MASVYTGYLDVDAGAKHLFFYFFESRDDPEIDDIVLWIPGGPGCTNALAVMVEQGMSLRSSIRGFRA